MPGSPRTVNTPVAALRGGVAEKVYSRTLTGATDEQARVWGGLAGDSRSRCGAK
jgi:hypothetical protein